jgi:hypothetical protein
MGRAKPAPAELTPTLGDLEMCENATGYRMSAALNGLTAHAPGTWRRTIR